MSKKEFTTTQVGAMIEHFQSQFEVFGEGLADVNKKLEWLVGRTDSMMEMIAKNTEDMTMLKIIAKALGRDVKDIKKELKRKPHREEFKALKERVSVLES